MAANNIRTPTILSEGDTGRPKGSGPMSVQLCGVQPPLPCIVILVHGVNDVGEAYENQDKGLCLGLNTRLGRQDMHAHDWKVQEFSISDTDGNITTKTCAVQEQTCIGVVNRSPIIPFYWGYKPVDHDTWKADQTRYKAELAKKGNDADLPYDTYREFDATKIKNHDGENTDNLNNWLDPSSAKGGGTFANATTNIPDMFGPGGQGMIIEMVARLKSRGGIMSDEDWSHPIYQNPHRIYQAYAARRLADLILDIRRNPDTRYDTINVVAHSQGTIITMLANMWVDAEGFDPADCVILNHSPYSMENRWMENMLPGHQQSDAARQKTFAHFCQLMAKNSHYQMGNVPHTGDYTQKLTDSGCLSKNAHKTLWNDPLYSRNNFGMVYNYFCPNDQVVSMTPIQGFGWRGIPDEMKAKNQMGNNLYQRVFCRDYWVGDKTGFHFEMPARKSGDSPNTGYSFKDVIINAPLLPTPFIFDLMGKSSTGYTDKLGDNDKHIAKAAMKAERLVHSSIEVPNSPQFWNLFNRDNLKPGQMIEVKEKYPEWEILHAEVSGNRGEGQNITLTRRMTEKELKAAAEIPSVYSQHSSIVASLKAPALSMAYDLAIGKCEAFEDQEFWDRLLLLADWRRGELNPDEKVRAYYQQGILPQDFKSFMNKPEREKGMPLGVLGVDNDYGTREIVQHGNQHSTENKTVNVLQWDMPTPQI
jgi:hypothetical protein